MSEPVAFVSAYRQLSAPERAFCDGFVSDLEREAQRRGERISLALYRAHSVADDRGMLSKPLVVAAISERITTIAADSELSVQRLVREITAIAFSSMEDYCEVDETGVPRFNLNGLTAAQWSAIAEINVEMDPRNPLWVRSFKLKLHPKMTGLDMLAKYTGMQEADNPHWRADNARPVGDAPMLPAHVTADGAADAYAAMIGG